MLELAKQFYQAGKSRLGDYCIARGNACARLASLCASAASAGVAPLLAEEPADHDPEADPPSHARLEAKLDAVRAVCVTLWPLHCPRCSRKQLTPLNVTAFTILHGGMRYKPRRRTRMVIRSWVLTISTKVSSI